MTNAINIIGSLSCKPCFLRFFYANNDLINSKIDKIYTKLKLISLALTGYTLSYQTQSIY